MFVTLSLKRVFLVQVYFFFMMDIKIVLSLVPELLQSKLTADHSVIRHKKNRNKPTKVL